MMNDALDKILNSPVTIEARNGASFVVRELSLDALARLQSWIRARYPHPIAAIRDYLDGLDPSERAALLEAARKDAAHWPPSVNSAEAITFVLNSHEGILTLALEALRSANPAATEADAMRLYHAIRHDDAAARRLFAAVFGRDDPETGEAPKAEAATIGRSPTA